jgi:hypothetical protein
MAGNGRVNGIGVGRMGGGGGCNKDKKGVLGIVSLFSFTF